MGEIKAVPPRVIEAVACTSRKCRHRSLSYHQCLPNVVASLHVRVAVADAARQLTCVSNSMTARRTLPPLQSDRRFDLLEGSGSCFEH